MSGLPPVEAVPALLQTQSDWEFVWANRWFLLEGTAITIALTVASLLLGFLVGFPAGTVEVYGEGLPKRLVETVGIVFRGTPIVVIFIFMFFVFPTPDLTFHLLVTDVTLGGAFVAGVLGLGLRSGAYQSQIFRGALQSVSEGQMEAARAIGLSKLGAVRHVVVPQALRRSVPGFQNEATIVLKDTSVVFAIGLTELLTRSFNLSVQQTTAVLELFIFASVIYFVLTFATNRTLDLVSAHYAVPGGET